MKIGTNINVDRKKRPQDKYIRICAGTNRGEYVHRLIAAAILGRDLFHTEVVHPIDGDTTNNHFSNLQILTWSTHGKITRLKYKKK